MPGGMVIRVAKIEIRKFRAKSSGRLNGGGGPVWLHPCFFLYSFRHQVVP
jgi:hypothetical protein